MLFKDSEKELHMFRICFLSNLNNFQIIKSVFSVMFWEQIGLARHALKTHSQSLHDVLLAKP